MNRQLKDSLAMAFAVTGGIATLFTIFGVSVSTLLPLPGVHWFLRIGIYAGIVASTYGILVLIIRAVIGRKYQDSIAFRVGKNTVTVRTGDIFQTPGWRVIPVDTTVSTVVDDKVISKKSLHGKLVLEHGDAEGIRQAVKQEAERRGIREENGSCRFPLGAVIPYEHEGKDGGRENYLMVAMIALDENLEAHTTMAQYEQTLMGMWREISRVYARNDIVLPLIGSGITRFDDDQGDPPSLLRCMLCTLNISRIYLNARVTVVIYDDGKTKLPLYEYKELFRIAR